jgi:hypothetical protein
MFFEFRQGVRGDVADPLLYVLHRLPSGVRYGIVRPKDHHDDFGEIGR